jgi:hypothetical protein
MSPVIRNDGKDEINEAELDAVPHLEPGSDATLWLCTHQAVILRDLVTEAMMEYPAASPILAEPSDIVASMHDSSVLDALRMQALHHLRAGEFAAALSWGRAAYVAHRRFAHGWLGFLNIALAAGALRQVDLVPPSLPAPFTGTPESPIPRHIVQYWDSVPPPDDVGVLIKEWATTRGYLHRLINDTEARRFLKAHFDGSVQEAYEAAPHVASRSDIFRLAWLARHGGLYVDADERRCEDVSQLVPSDAGLVINWSDAETPCINNWFFAARPNHPLVWSQLRLGVSRVLRARERGMGLSAWILTGPGVTTMCLLDTVCSPNGSESGLSDVRMHSEPTFRTIVSNVWELAYKEDPATNWKLGPSA